MVILLVIFFDVVPPWPLLMALHLYYEMEGNFVQLKMLIHDLSNYIDDQLLSETIVVTQNIMEIRNSHKAEVPSFDFENFSRKGFKELQVSEESGVVKYISIQPSH